MGSETLSFLLGILTLAFGGCNIVQLINNRALKRKMEAEADHTKYDAQQVVITGLQDEVKRLQQRVTEGDEQYSELHKNYMELQDIVIELRAKVAILEKNNNK